MDWIVFWRLGSEAVVRDSVDVKWVRMACWVSLASGWYGLLVAFCPLLLILRLSLEDLAGLDWTFDGVAFCGIEVGK